MAKPSKLPRWADGGTATEPTEADKTVGFLPSTITGVRKAFAQIFNWLFNTIYLWLSYFDSAIKLDTTIGGTSTPAAAATAGVLYKDMVPFCVCSFVFFVGPGLTFKRGYNVASVDYIGVGQYNITLSTGFSGSGSDQARTVLGSFNQAASGGGGPPYSISIVPCVGGDATKIRINLFDKAGAAVDGSTDFTIVAWDF